MEIIASLGSLAIGVIILYVIVKLLALPFKLVWNGIIGAIMLWLANLLGGTLFGVTINITIIKALIAGFFGIPGAAAGYYQTDLYVVRKRERSLVFLFSAPKVLRQNTTSGLK